MAERSKSEKRIVFDSIELQYELNSEHVLPKHMRRIHEGLLYTPTRPYAKLYKIQSRLNPYLIHSQKIPIVVFP